MFFGIKSQEKEDAPVSEASRPAQVKRRRRSYLPFSSVQEIFPELSAQSLCSLLELTAYSPLDVLGLAPKATAKQLSKFFDLVEKMGPPHNLDHVTVEEKHSTAYVSGNYEETSAVEYPAGLHEDFYQKIKDSVSTIKKEEQNLHVTFSNELKKKSWVSWARLILQPFQIKQVKIQKAPKKSS